MIDLRLILIISISIQQGKQIYFPGLITEKCNIYNRFPYSGILYLHFWFEARGFFVWYLPNLKSVESEQVYARPNIAYPHKRFGTHFINACLKFSKLPKSVTLAKIFLQLVPCEPSQHTVMTQLPLHVLVITCTET